MTTARTSIAEDVGRDFMGRYADAAEEQDAVRDPARRSPDSLRSFLDGVYAHSADAEGIE